jgi:acyl-coenzyme A synthetase/AMP-(fatty) acid ligase
LHFLALTALGAVPAMMNSAMPTVVAIRYLDHIGAEGLVVDDPTRLVAGFRSHPNRHRPHFIAPTAELRVFDGEHSALPTAYPYRHRADEIVGLIHSSGTTGTPKSTMLAHRQFWEGKQMRMERFPAEPYDRLMSLMPHSHAGGLSYFMTATLLGLPTMVMGDWRREVVEPIMEVFQPTMIASFPRTFVELATGELPERGAANVHSWFNTGDSAHYGHIRRLVQLGQRPAGLIKPWLLPRDQAEQASLPGSQFIDGLGSSEMGMALFGQVTTPESERNDRCIGKPLEVVHETAVLDSDGNTVPDGTIGMLAVKTPSRTPGYWNDPELTKSFELNGFWLTGDIARRDSTGNFYHLDRTLDVIDTADGPVYSLPIEEILIADCDSMVQDCAVIGVPSSQGTGSVPIGVVRPTAHARGITETEALKQANQALADAGMTELEAIIIAERPDDYPTGITGKVLKRELRTRLATLFTDPTRVTMRTH